MKNKQLLIKQLDDKIQQTPMALLNIPIGGWVTTIRKALGISLQQIAGKMAITPQSVKEIEQREVTGSITLKSLGEAADAMDMKLVYGFVPKDGSIDKMIERKARQVAESIVMSTSHNMKLEGQENTPERIAKAIEEMTATLKQEMPKYLWD